MMQLKRYTKERQLSWSGETGREKWPFSHHSKSGHRITTQAVTAGGTHALAAFYDSLGRWLHFSTPNKAREVKDINSKKNTAW